MKEFTYTFYADPKSLARLDAAIEQASIRTSRLERSEVAAYGFCGCFNYKRPKMKLKTGIASMAALMAIGSPRRR